MHYTPALDGVRALAIVLVMLFHARAPAVLGGYVGVDVFFVLSGYLITSLLLHEIDATCRVDLRRFYRRRFLRLTPALLVMLGVYLVVAPLLWSAGTDHGLHAAVAAVYLADYGVALWGLPDILSHTWSLAVEAHFYLLWPVLLVAAHRRWPRPSLVTVLATAYVLATLLRWVCVIRGQTWAEVYYRFDTHMSGLILGACLATVQRDGRFTAAVQRALPWLLWLPLGAVVCLQYRWHDIWMLMWGFGIVEWATVALLLGIQSPGSQISAMLSPAPLVWLGKMSYGLYLWHYPIFRYLRERHTWDDVLLIGAPLALVLAAASYYTIEAWAARRRGPSTGFAPSGTV